VESPAQNPSRSADRGKQTATGPAPEVSIVVPTYREAENIRTLATRIAAAMSPTGRPYETILVDDDSRDGTDQLVADLLREGLPLRLIVRVGERGLSSAVIRGFREAQGHILVCMDADLSHPPEALPRLIAALDDPSVDFVIGSRHVEGGSTDENWGLLRHLYSGAAALMARPFTRAKDPMAGYFALPRRVFQRADALNPIGYKIGLELMVKCDCAHVREIPIHFADRKFGRSKLNLKEQLRYVNHLCRLGRYKLARRFRHHR